MLLKILHKAYLLVAVTSLPVVIMQTIQIVVLSRTNTHPELIALSVCCIGCTLVAGFIGAYAFAVSIIKRLASIRSNIEQIRQQQPVRPVKQSIFIDELVQLDQAVANLTG